MNEWTNDFVITGIANVILVGEEEYPEPETHFSGTTQHNELIFHLSGEAVVRFGDEVLHTEPGIVRFLPLGDFGRYDVERIRHGSCIDVFFDTDRPVAPRAFLHKTGTNRRVAELFRKIFSVWVSRREGYRRETMGLLYLIFAEMEKSAYLPEEKYRLIRPAVTMIENGFSDPSLSVPALAAACGISESYCKRLFTEKFGMPPKKLILSMRINYAADLLLAGHDSVTAISRASGFSDVYYFSRQFKLYRGMSPTAFAKKYRSSK